MDDQGALRIPPVRRRQSTQRLPSLPVIPDIGPFNPPRPSQIEFPDPYLTHPKQGETSRLSEGGASSSTGEQTGKDRSSGMTTAPLSVQSKIALLSKLNSSRNLQTVGAAAIAAGAALIVRSHRGSFVDGDDDFGSERFTPPKSAPGDSMETPKGPVIPSDRLDDSQNTAPDDIESSTSGSFKNFALKAMLEKEKVSEACRMFNVFIFRKNMYSALPLLLGVFLKAFSFWPLLVSFFSALHSKAFTVEDFMEWEMSLYLFLFILVLSFLFGYFFLFTFIEANCIGISCIVFSIVRLINIQGINIQEVLQLATTDPPQTAPNPQR